MRRQKAPSTILVDDVSPRTLTDDFLPRLSVDLVGSDYSYSPPMRQIERVQPGELAVIEELESIRSMIESKSKDLHRKEASLSRSITNWNSEVFEAQRLIEELAENLTISGEARVKEQFTSCENRLNKLVEKVSGSMRSLIEIKSRSLSGTADVPPLPNKPQVEILDHRVLEFISYSPSSISRQVSGATVLLLSQRNLSEPQQRFALNYVFNAVFKMISGRFDRLVRQSLESDLSLQPIEMASKFSAMKQSVLKKRLGIPTLENCAQPVSIVIHEEFTGSEDPIDIEAELDDDLKANLKSSMVMDEEVITSSSAMVKLFSDTKVQVALIKNLRSRSMKKSIKYRLVDTLVGPTSDRMIIDNLTAIKRECGSYPTLSPTLVPKLIACVLFIVHRTIEDERSIEIANVACDILDSYINSVAWQPVVSRFMAAWTQGTWFLMRTILNWKGSYVGSRALDSLAGIIRASDCVQALIPWQPVIVDRLNKNQFHQAVVPYAKAILKQLGNS